MTTLEKVRIKQAEFVIKRIEEQLPNGGEISFEISLDVLDKLSAASETMDEWVERHFHGCKITNISSYGTGSHRAVHFVIYSENVEALKTLVTILCVNVEGFSIHDENAYAYMS